MADVVALVVIFVMPVVLGAIVGYITSRPRTTPPKIRKEPRFGKV